MFVSLLSTTGINFASLVSCVIVLMMVTSFVKISVVLSIVRSALGTQQIPPTQVITGLAIILTVYIMSVFNTVGNRAIMIGIALVSFIATLTNGMKASNREAIEEQVAADYVVTSLDVNVGEV